ncbi:TATA box-binding protein-associated factor RNA polymerase I subunit B isoform X2 [Nematostella vectensis]|nr:TATA box-binding protein-associated factor RNA polymerase I subunit B isoform X2 [Nematostella vectensis]
MLAEIEFDNNISRAIEKKKKPGRPRLPREKGKPWLMQEAIQFILKAQVKFLVSEGIQPELKDIVGQIWFAYLRKKKLAFFENPPSPSEILKKGRQHESKRNKNRKKELSDTESELPELCSEFDEESCYSGDKPTKAEEKTEDLLFSDSDTEDDKSGDENIGSLNSNSRQNKSLCLRTTVAIIYLALLQLNEPTFLSDIIRWIKEGSFPYFGGTRFLPNYMKLSHSDSRALSLNCVPMRQHVLMNARSIARTLNIKSFPQQDLKIYISRYILDLNLPGIIHGFVHRLMQILTPLFSVFGKTLQRNDYELAAMAYILMAVKLCYGLDDKNDNSKRFQEALSQTTDEAVDTHNTLPLWSDWASCAQACQSKRREAGVPWTDEELRETRDPRTYGTFCKTAAFGSWASRDPEMLEGKAAIPAKKRSVRKERWNNCAEIFSNLVATPEAPCTDQHTTTSFPTACRHATDDTNDCFHTTRDRRLSLESTSKLCSERSVSRETDDESCQQFRRYVCYLRPGSFMNTRPSSYDFLLRLLSSRIEARPEDLEKLLVKLESAMFAISQGKELPNYGSRRF